MFPAKYKHKRRKNIDDFDARYNYSTMDNDDPFSICIDRKPSNDELVLVLDHKNISYKM